MVQLNIKECILLTSFTNDVYVRNLELLHYHGRPNSVKLYRHPVFGFIVRVHIIKTETHIFNSFDDAFAYFSQKVEIMLANIYL